MIPTNRELKSKLSLDAASYLILDSTSFFETAEEYVRLQTMFLKETHLEKLMLWIEMLISPLISIIMCFYNETPPSIFTMMGFHKTFTLWADWVSYTLLSAEIAKWTSIVRSVGGPFISTNDPTYHVFVYADGMERLRSGLLRTRLAEKGAKRL